MASLNYHHLQYFWAVAREGSITRACRQLGLSQPTVSSQLKALEAALGVRLFDRVGRGLVLTESGRTVLHYAEGIFALGGELLSALEARPTRGGTRLSVGIVDSIPKTVARRLLDPATKLGASVRLVCREGRADRLLAALGAHELDIVLSDGPIGTAVQLRGFNHLIGECGVGFFAAPKLAARLTPGFPQSLEGVPVLLPTDGSTMRRALNDWFDGQRIHPTVLAEFDDSALMNSFGRSGTGVFPAPLVVEDDIRRQYGARLIGSAAGVRVRFYAISTEQKLRHPAVIAVLDTARRELFQ